MDKLSAALELVYGDREQEEQQEKDRLAFRRPLVNQQYDDSPEDRQRRISTKLIYERHKAA